MRFFLTLLFLQVFSCIECKKNGSNTRPNIVFIMVDDYGYNDVGYHNKDIITPNIDSLAKDGVRLENYYVQPICSPSRTSLMSGNYVIHTGQQHGVIMAGEARGLPLSFPTVADRLKEGGYKTHMVGKWHVGMITWNHTPLYRGFDTFYGYLLGCQDYYTHLRKGALDFRDQMEPVFNSTEYSTHAYAKRSVEIINNSSSNDPFFLYLSFQAVHIPIEVPSEYSDMYSNIPNKNRREFSGMVTAMDEAIGKVTQALKEKGIYDNTVIILSTDNGARAGQHGGGSNYPLKGEKNTLWEGGVRAVGFVHSKLLSKPGRISKDLIHITDWYPTMLHLAGIETEGMTLDGHSVWNTLSEGEESPRKEILYNIDPLSRNKGKLIYDVGFDHRKTAAIRVGVYKLLTGSPGNGNWFPNPTHKNEVEYSSESIDSKKKSEKNLWLYNIKTDPKEKHDLADSHPKVVKKLLQRLASYNATAVPAQKPKHDKRSDPANFNNIWTPWLPNE